MVKEAVLRKFITQPKKISELEFEEIFPIINKAKKKFHEESLVIELSTKENEEVYVIGDIHGNLDSLLEIHDIIEKKNPKYVIFLGDIVDRGQFQLECLIFVLCLKLLDPSKYYLLRGNHETLDMNRYYGFYDEFSMKYKDKNQFSKIVSLYNTLSICCIVNSSVICVHGGVPENLNVLEELEGLKEIEIDYSTSDSVAKAVFQMMWNDPKEGLSGFMHSFRGQDIKFYGKDVFERFLNKYNLNYMIRAHEVFAEGYRWFFDEQLLSIFTSSDYRSLGSNQASYAIVKNQKIYAKILQ